MKHFVFISTLLGFAFILSSCASTQKDSMNAPQPQSTAAVVVSKTPEWFDMELTDVQTGKTFTMNDYAGKVVLLETMAIWCPNCLLQSGELQKLHQALGNPKDLIS